MSPEPRARFPGDKKLSNRAMIMCIQMNKPAGSKENIQEIIELERRGLNYLNDGDPQSAIECFEKIFYLSPNWENGQNFYNLGCAYEEVGDVQAAELNYLRSISYDPGGEMGWNALAGLIYLDGQIQRAIHLFNFVKRLAIKNGDVVRVKEIDALLVTLNGNV